MKNVKNINPFIDVSLNFEEDTGSTSKHIQQSYQLHDAVRNKQLINIPIGLDITLIDERNQTCLDIALENGDEAAVKILLGTYNNFYCKI